MNPATKHYVNYVKYTSSSAPRIPTSSADNKSLVNVLANRTIPYTGIKIIKLPVIKQE